jgi:membrane protease YdiL (CAAX protease family)
MLSLKIKKFFFAVAIFFILLIGYLLPAWWKFIPSTLAIIGTTYFFSSFQFHKKLGLTGDLRHWVHALILLSVVFYLSPWVMNYALDGSGYSLVKSPFIEYLVSPFQTLNEEMVFRGLLLTFLLNTRLTRGPVVILPALIFGLFHWLFFKYNLASENRGELTLVALFTIILFGIATNALFVKTGSIALPWALHLGWNLNRFGSHISFVEDPLVKIPEVTTFNLLEGQYSVLFLSLVLALAALIYLFGNQKRDSVLQTHLNS